MSIECVCPVCGRNVIARRASDGYGWEKSTGPLRIVIHSGARWGRTCKGSDQEYQPKQEARP